VSDGGHARHASALAVRRVAVYSDCIVAHATHQSVGWWCIVPR